MIGALFSSILASHVFSCKPSIFFFYTLAGAVWVIYTIDHIFDGFQSKNHFTDPVYRFHYIYRKTLFSILVVVVLSTAIIVFTFLERELIFYGLAVFSLVLVYLFLNIVTRKKGKYFPKEFIIAVLYTAGVYGGMAVLSGKVNFIQILVVCNFFLLVLANVLFFSYLDYEDDQQCQFNTLAHYIGRKRVKRFVIIVLVIAFLSSQVLGFYYAQWMYQLTFTLMNLTLLFIIVLEEKNGNKRNLGMMADAIFFYQVIFLFL